jgi:hypothetical protein
MFKSDTSAQQGNENHNRINPFGAEMAKTT